MVKVALALKGLKDSLLVVGYALAAVHLLWKMYIILMQCPTMHVERSNMFEQTSAMRDSIAMR